MVDRRAAAVQANSRPSAWLSHRRSPREAALAATFVLIGYDVLTGNSRPAAFSRIGFDETTDVAVETGIYIRNGGPRDFAQAFSEGAQPMVNTSMVNTVLERFGGDIANAEECPSSD